MRRSLLAAAAVAGLTVALTATPAQAAPTFFCNGEPATIVSPWSSGSHTIFGTFGDDVIVSFDGNDTIQAWSGNDLVCSGEGNDTIEGFFGEDVFFGEGGNDRIEGGGEPDSLYGGPGDDYIVDDISMIYPNLADGGPGNDRCYEGIYYRISCERNT